MFPTRAYSNYAVSACKMGRQPVCLCTGWTAPEVMEGKPYDSIVSDIFSIGKVLSTLFPSLHGFAVDDSCITAKGAVLDCLKGRAVACQCLRSVVAMCSVRLKPPIHRMCDAHLRSSRSLSETPV